ncbi:TMV resistance protein N-like [Punica granatum]|uniref:TMV resistance protein N-like n=1 Tax=Punica granatum TaxID=22663 RepID=A0A6P8C9U3_PUNGR|nr:TMV resistance protein N-like [Punica granatum]XP_031380512.1 TMV resistance protein N-like [Punica granatum]
MQKEMLGFLFFCVCLLFGLCSCCGFTVCAWFLCTKKIETAMGQQKEEAAEKEDDSEASVSSDYEVFLSFRGPDSRQGHADVLYNDMRTAGIRVFGDDDELDIGDKIGKILPAIEKSKICVPIFSSTFAASAWCLREVERMVEFKKKIMPIFYTATPEDVKLGTELFKKELRKHEKKHGKEQVKKWEEALKMVARIKGREVKATGFAKFSKLFVRALLIKLEVKTKYLTDSLVKRDDHEEKLLKLLDIDSSDVRIIGIHGMGGIGKTTLAKVIFNQLSARFDCCSFLENIQESLRRNGLQYLQKQLVEDLDPKLKNFQKIDTMTMLRENFRRRRALIVLDDVNQRKQIEMIVGMLGWFGSGSRIIITTRDISIFTKEARTLVMQEMDRDQALQLFSRHAFGEDSPPSDFRILSDEVISLTGRLPLAIEVIGSLLYQREKKRWKATIERLKNVPNRDVQEKLKISFDALEFDQKQIFLDIACFFINKERSNAILMWEACDFYPDDGIEVLVSMSLVKITGNKFQMHDLIKDLGRELVREECFGDPTKRSRIWSSKEAKELLKIKQEKENVEGLFLEKLYGDGILKHEQFSGFRNLRLLKLVGAKLTGDFENLLPKLKWFTWQRCPSDFAATNLTLENLVVLDLSDSFITENWVGWNMIQIAKNLKALDLTRCCNLTSTPDLSNNDALERLILGGCRNLAEIHGSINKLTRLKHLDLQGCPSLRGLPEELGSLEDLEEILVDGNHGATFHLPESIGNLYSLSVMKLHGVEITRIPDSIGGLVNLTHLSMSECSGMKTLPDVIGDLKSLVKLDMSGTELSALPNSVGWLTRLQSLCLSSTKIEELPDTLGDLKSLETLNLYESKLRILPDAVGDLESLVTLNLSDTKLCALPDSVGRLSKLRWLWLESTKIEELPDSLGDLKSLEILELKSSKLRILPDSVGEMSELRDLLLDGCNIRKLPSSIWKLAKLEHLSAGTCHFLTDVPKDSQSAEFPTILNQLSHLRDLSITPYGVPSLQDQVCNFSIDGIKNLTNLENLELQCLGLECLPQLPSTLRMLKLTYISARTKLPDFSNLKKLRSIDFEYCFVKDEQLEVLRGLQGLRLTSMHVLSCSEELVKLSCQMGNLTQLDISGRESLAESPLLDFSRLENLKKLRLRCLKELAEIWGLGELEYLEDLDIWNCNSLEMIGNLSESKRLKEIYIVRCPKLREIRGLNKLFLASIHIEVCGSVRNIDELKKRCVRGHFNGLEVENNAD